MLQPFQNTRRIHQPTFQLLPNTQQNQQNHLTRMSFLQPLEDDHALEAALAFLDEYDADGKPFPAVDHDVELEPLQPEPERASAPTTDVTTNSTDKTNASEASSTDGSVVSKSKPVRSGPKRVRKRQKDELIYLRCRVSELEERLTRLQKRSRKNDVPTPSSPTLSNMSSTSGSSGGDDESGPPTTAKPSAQLAAVWEKVAARQHEQRQQAEIENAKLKEMLEEQIRVARSLERVLRRRANDDVRVFRWLATYFTRLAHIFFFISSFLFQLLQSTHPTKKFTWNRVATKDEEAIMFQDMLQGLEQQYREAPGIFSLERFPTSRGAIFRDITVRMTGEDPVNQPGEDDMGEMYIDVLDCKILPFDFRSTAAAFWTHMTQGESAMKSLFRETFELTDDTMARSFGVEINAGPMRGQFRGKQCVRRYQEENRVVIVWTMLAEPLEISGTFMGGLLMRQKSWVELTPSSEDPTQATQVRARYMMTPDSYDDDEAAKSQDRRIGALTDFVIHSAHGNLNASHQLIENILVQRSLMQKSAA
jgi:hypothetical protein